MNTDERELRDPALVTLLRESYRDDPALDPAPGRTERIMRAVMATAPRRQAHPFWASLAWGFGAAAMAILLLGLIIGFGRPGEKIVHRGPDPLIKPEQQKPDFKLPDIDQVANGTQPPRPKQAVIPDLAPKPEEKEPEPWPAPARQEEPVTVPPAPDQQEVVVAAALYEAGAAAYSTGDYESAYQAFQESYDTVPTPDAALSTGNALIRMAREELASANSDT